MVESIKVGFKDSQRKNLKDKFGTTDTTNQTHSEQSSIRGRVKIYEHKIGGSDKKLFLLHETDNLIVYRGRNFIMQRAFGQDHGGAATARNWKDYAIQYLAVGTGGAASGNPLTAISPVLTDDTLTTHGVLGASANIVNILGNAYHTFDSGYPLFISDPDIASGSMDSSGDGAKEDLVNFPSGDLRPGNTFLITQVKVTIAASEGNSTGFQDISEAALFASPIVSPLTDAQMFARVTFPTIRKSDDREIVFVWQIFF